MKEKSRLGAFPGGIRLSDSRRAPTQIPLAAPRNPFQLWMGAAKICLFPKSQAKKKKPEQGDTPTPDFIARLSRTFRKDRNFFQNPGLFH